MVARVESALLQEEAGDFLCPLGQLGAGEALGGGTAAVEQGEQRVVGRSGGPPAEDLGDELVLLAAATWVADSFVLQAAYIAAGGCSQTVTLKNIALQKILMSVDTGTVPHTKLVHNIPTISFSVPYSGPSWIRTGKYMINQGQKI